MAGVSDEWEIERLDLAAYLRRVGHDGALPPTAETLTAVHRAHLAAIPFENLDVVLGRGISVALADVQAKLVDRRRGGYCYEHGLLFAAVLERLGYAVERRLARVGDGERPGPRTHMTLEVRAEGGHWLADVGFGSGLLEPLPFDADAHAMANHFTSTYPRSPFVGRVVAVRKDRESVIRLVGRTLTVTRPDWSVEERRLSDGEVAAALREVFRIPLDAEEVARLTAGLPD